MGIRNFMQLFSKVGIIQNKEFNKQTFTVSPLHLEQNAKKATPRPWQSGPTITLTAPKLTFVSLLHGLHFCCSLCVEIFSTLPHSGLGLNVTFSERSSLSLRLDQIPCHDVIFYNTLILVIVHLMLTSPPPQPHLSIKL